MKVKSESLLPKVSIICNFYNHEQFIHDALESFIAQKTNFTYEILVHDDASSDLTAIILKEYQDKYPDLIKPIFQKENKGKLGINVWTEYQFPRATGQYIALCDGDDYWTDPLKLQKQVDFLEGNPDFILCYHWQSFKYERNAGVYYGETLGADQMATSSLKDLFEWKVRIETRTMMFRNIFNDSKLPDWFSKIAFGDIALNFIFGAFGKFGFINENMAVYRITGSGISLNGRVSLSEKKWIIAHHYKWLSIWLYANAHHNRKYLTSVIKGYNFFLYRAIINENFVSSVLRQIVFILRHDKGDFVILKYSLQFIFKHFISKNRIKLKKLVKNLIRKSGYELKKYPTVNRKLQIAGGIDQSMNGALNRLKKLRIDPNTIIDVGAAAGNWTRLALAHWPSASYHLIEPLQEQAVSLNDLKLKYSRLNWHQGVAGNETSIVKFSVSNDLDGSGVYGNDAENVREVPVFKIDDILKNVEGPFLIKLDTHGYEIPIIEGASVVLAKTEVLIIEVYGFHVSPTAVLFHKLTEHLETLGFRLFDLVDIIRREKDGAFWQADAVYLKSNHEVFENNNYR